MNIYSYRLNARTLPSTPHDAGIRGLLDLLFNGTCNLMMGSACNLACTYCSVGHNLPVVEPWPQLKLAIDRCAELGFRKAAYMGGEPTVHPHLMDMARRLKEKGFGLTVLATNGVKLADPAFVDRLASAGVSAFVFSVDAFEKRTQEGLYGGLHRYQDVMQGLRNALSRTELPVAVNGVVNTVTLGSLRRNVDTLLRLRTKYGRTMVQVFSLMHVSRERGHTQVGQFVDLVRSAKTVRAALSHARQNGLPAIVAGYPPCLLEECAPHAFEMYVSEYAVDLDTGKAKKTGLNQDRVVSPACAKCRYFKICGGVIERYASKSTMKRVSERGSKLQRA